MNPSTYVCSTAARWLPRVMAGAVLTFSLSVAWTLDPGNRVPFSHGVRVLVGLVGAMLAIRLVRGGSEVRAEVRLHDLGIEFAAGKHKATLAYAAIRSLDYVPPFMSLRLWLPAALLMDDADRRWRLCSLLDDGERLIDDLLARSDRSDLRAWAEARAVSRKMARRNIYLGVGYGFAVLLLLITWLWVSR